MVKKLRLGKTSTAGAVLVALTFVCGCGDEGATVGDITSLVGAEPDGSNLERVLGTEPANQCGSSVERHLANLAAASADELGRWEVTTDFEIAPDGQTLQLSREGEARCNDSCPIIRTTLLVQQRELAAAGGVPEDFGPTLLAGWKRQKQEEASRVASIGHELEHVSTEAGACGELFWFDAREAGCSGDCTYHDPGALASKLVFAGYPDNPYLQFESATDFEGKPASMIAIDPSGYMTGGGSGCSGSCEIGCIAYSKPSAFGTSCNCCLCGGVYGEWIVSQWSTTTYLCATQ